jgi:hypothetical protein
MNFDVMWDDDNLAIIHQILPQNWVWDDFYAAKYAAETMMDCVSHPVGVILRLPISRSLRESAVMNWRTLTTRNHRNLHKTAIVAPNLYVQTILSLMMKGQHNFDKQYILVATIEEARDILSEKYPITAVS